MSLRNLIRRPFQTTVTAVGLSLSLALLLFAEFQRAAIEQLIEQEFEQSQKQSHTLLLAKALPLKVLQSLSQKLPAGMVEGHTHIPVVLKFKNEKRDLNLVLSSPQQILRNDREGSTKTLSTGALHLSQSLADALGIRKGDLVEISTRDVIPHTLKLVVSDFNENLMGYSASLPAREYSVLTRQTHTTNVILFRSQNHVELNSQKLVSGIPQLNSIYSKRFEKQVFKQTVSENIGTLQGFMIAFALIIAAGVLYNNSRIQFAERTSELSLLRAVGFSERELTLIFWKDYFILLFFSIVPGLWLGRILIQWIIRGMETEMFRIPILFTLRMQLSAVVVLLLGVLGAILLIQPSLRKIPFIVALKERE